MLCNITVRILKIIHVVLLVVLIAFWYVYLELSDPSCIRKLLGWQFPLWGAFSFVSGILASQYQHLPLTKQIPLVSYIIFMVMGILGFMMTFINTVY